MNQIVFNVSLIILSLGLILMVIYITIVLTTKKIISTQCKPCLPCNLNDSKNNSNGNGTSTGTNNGNNTLEQIYDDRPSITYIKMFKDSNIGFGQDNFDATDDVETSSFYFKSKKII